MLRLVGNMCFKVRLRNFDMYGCRQLYLTNFLLWLIILCTSSCVSINGQNHSTSDHYLVDFSSEIIDNEYIVSFKEFYNYDARLKYIKAALKSYDPSSWQILPRNNPASNFPSDFDVLQLQREIIEKGIPALKRHHSIKHVTPQRKVTRTLTTLDGKPISWDENETEMHQGCEYTQKWSSSRPFPKRSSLSLGSILENAGNYFNRHLLRTLPRQITGILQADVLWNIGIRGAGVKVAVFDTGLVKIIPILKK